MLWTAVVAVLAGLAFTVTGGATADLCTQAQKTITSVFGSACLWRR